MRILGEGEIGDFCTGPADSQDQQLVALAESGLRPAGLLPWFQLCSYVHARARAGWLDVPAFRACWSRLVERHSEMSADGYLLHVSDGARDTDALLKTLGTLARPQRRERHAGEDLRTFHDERKEQILRDRVWSSHEQAMPELDTIAERDLHWRWHCNPPDDLPERTYPGRDGSTDLVVDTNVLVEVLDAIPLDASLGVALPLPGLEAPVRRRISPVLSGEVLGKLIIPVSVLIEAEGVTAAKSARYARAAAVLEDIAVNPQHRRYGAFAFESFTDESFAAFLRLVECLVAADVDPDWWPRLGDALVLAHGLMHGCAVASNEWIHKDEWRRTQLGHAFPYLVLI